MLVLACPELLSSETFSKAHVQTRSKVQPQFQTKEMCHSEAGFSHPTAKGLTATQHGW